jgi:hypothetical protein
MNIEDIEEAIYEQTQEFVPQCVYKAILNLIAAEREACAKVCDEVDKESQSQWPKRLATMIRARSKS